MSFNGANAQTLSEKLLDTADSLWQAGEQKIALKNYQKAYQKANVDSVKMRASSSLNDAFLGYTNSLMAKAGNTPAKSARNYQVATIYYKKYLDKIFPDKKSKAHQDSLLRFKLLTADEYFKSEQYQPAGRIYKKAIKELTKAGSTAEEMQEISLQLAQCYIELKNYPKAGQLYKSAYGKDKLLSKAEELYCKGYYQKSARIFSYLHHKITKPEELILYTRLIARAYFKGGDEENARFWYNQCLDENNLLSENAVINFNQNCESCDQLLKNEGFFIERLKDPGQLDIDRFYFAQVQLNYSGKLLEASNLINNTTIIYHACENSSDPCVLFDKTYHVSALTSEGINSSISSEYSPVYFENDTLIFASDRNPLRNKIVEVNGEERSTFDLYQQRMNESDVLGYNPEMDPLPLDSLSQTSRFFTFNRGVYYNEGPMAFYPGAKDKFIFTGNYFKDTDELKGSQVYEGDRINTLKLFSAAWSNEDSTWKVTPLIFEGESAELFNSELYSVAHPTFNAEGTTLYFSSDVPMPGNDKTVGTFGNSDIFKSTYDPNTGKLGAPVNLGAEINSEGNELFPYLYTDENGNETLYFSSNFHEDDGLGQLDIYYAAFCNGGFANRENIGAPLNSAKDDFGLVLNKQGTAGFLSSDRAGGDDIYKFRELKVLITVLDKETMLPVSAARIDLIPSVGDFITGRVPEGGTTVYRKFELASEYEVKVNPDDEIYFGNGTSFTTELAAFDAYGILRDTILLEKKPEVKMIVLANVKSWQQVFVAFSKNVGTLGTADSINGSVNYSTLYEFGYDVEKGRNYLQNTEDGTFTYISPVGASLFSIVNMEKVNKQNALKQFFIKNQIIVPDSVESDHHIAANPVVIRNIRYGFDSSNFSANDAEHIDPDVEFRKMAEVLRDYKHLMAKMSSHTDECPLPPYEYDNMALSGRRNNAAVEGLKKHYEGLDTNRLVLCNYDGSYPVDTSEENYSKNRRGQLCANQYNRRTEFKLVYTQRNKYSQDCDCNDESMILAPKMSGTSSLGTNSATQGGR